MISGILSSGIFGFVGALITPIIESWHDRRASVIKMETTKLQMELEYSRHIQELEFLQKQTEMQIMLKEIHIEENRDNNYREMYNNEIKQNIEALNYDKNDKTGIIIDSIRALVRPIITYCFSGVFLYLLIITILTALKQYGNTIDGFKSLFEIEFVQNMEYLFANITTFWFGNRMVDKYKKR